MKSTFRGMSIKPETAEEINDCATPDGMRRRIREYGWRGDAMTKSILDAAMYRGMSGEDTMTWLAFEALRRAEHYEDMVLEHAMTNPQPPVILVSHQDNIEAK